MVTTSLVAILGFSIVLLNLLPKGNAFFHISKIGRVIKSQNIVTDIETRHGDHDKAKQHFNFHHFSHYHSQLYSHVNEEVELLDAEKSPVALDHVHSSVEIDALAQFLYKATTSDKQPTDFSILEEEPSANTILKDSFSIRDAQNTFRSLYPAPIIPHYRTFLSDFLVALFWQLMDKQFQYDAVFAFGLCTEYYTMMQTYEAESEIDAIFQALLTSCHLNARRLIQDASSLLKLVQETQNSSDKDFWDCASTQIPPQYRDRNKHDDHHSISDFGAIGLMRLFELRQEKQHSQPQRSHSSRTLLMGQDTFPGRLSSRMVSLWMNFVQRQERMRPVWLTLRRQHQTWGKNPDKILLVKNSLAYLQRKIHLWTQHQRGQEIVQEQTQTNEREKALLQLNEAIFRTQFV